MGRKLRRFGNSMKGVASLAVGTTAGVGLAVTVVGGAEAGKATYHYFTDTEMYKKHFWSRPIEVYCRNGQPVNKKGGK